VLVLNVGSSTLKVALFEPGSTVRLWEASTQRKDALLAQLQGWLEPQLQPWWPQIQTAGHRLVHGGERFRAPPGWMPPCLAGPAAMGLLRHRLSPQPAPGGPHLRPARRLAPRGHSPLRLPWAQPSAPGGGGDAQLLEKLSSSMAWLGSVTWRQIVADEEGMIARLVSRADPAFGAAAG